MLSDKDMHRLVMQMLSDDDLNKLFELACFLPEVLGCDVQREVGRERQRRHHEDDSGDD